MTPLHWVCDPQMADALIAHGASVSSQNLLGETPLHTCARRGDYAVCSALVCAGADIRALDNNGNSPISRCSDHLAAMLEEAAQEVA